MLKKIRNIINMKKEKAYNEDVMSEQEDSTQAPDTATEEAAADKVADTEEQTTDTMADEATPSAEEQLQSEVALWKDKFLRLQAEFDNYRKRTLREKMALIETGGSDVLKAMLPVRDDIQRALDAMQKTDDKEAVVKGVELIAQKFTEALKQKGVTEIEVIGKPFDEEVAEAVARFPAGEDKKGLVIDAVQTGYKLGDKVLRFAKVVVGE